MLKKKTTKNIYFKIPGLSYTTSPCCYYNAKIHSWMGQTFTVLTSQRQNPTSPGMFYRGSPISAVFGFPANRTIGKLALIGD